MPDGDRMSEIVARCPSCGASTPIPGPPRCVPLDLVGSVIPCPSCGGAAELVTGRGAGADSADAPGAASPPRQEREE